MEINLSGIEYKIAIVGGILTFIIFIVLPALAPMMETLNDPNVYNPNIYETDEEEYLL